MFVDNQCIQIKYFVFFVVVYLIYASGNKVFAQNNADLVYTPPAELVDSTNANVTMYQNLRYGAIPDSIEDATSDRILDLYLPRNHSKDLLPVFVFMHGGGFRNGDKGVTAIRNLCSCIASEGIAVISINYRLTLQYNKFTDSIRLDSLNRTCVNGKFNQGLRISLNRATNDAIIALSWIKKNSRKFKFNSNMVAVGGSSAGSMTVLNLAYVSNQKKVRIKAVLNLWGALENSELIKKYAPPLLTYHGDNDKIVSVNYALALKNRMDKVGNKKSVCCLLEGQGHAQYDAILNFKKTQIISFLKNNLTN